MADPSDIQEGTKVRWGYADGNVYGKVKNKSTSSTLSSESGGSSGGLSLTGSSDDPVFKIENYDKQDGEWGPTGDVTVHRADNLSVIDSWPENA